MSSSQPREFEALIQQQLTLAQLAESAPSSVVIVDSLGRIVMANTNALKMFGYTHEELQGQAVEVLMPERFRSNHVPYRQEFARHPSVRPMGTGRALWASRKDGTEFPVDIQLSPFQGEGALTVTVIWDLTARKLAEDRLRESEEKYRRIVETMAEGVVVLDPDDRIVFINSQMAAMVGVEPQEILGRTPLDFLDKAEAARAQEDLDKARQGLRGRCEFRVPKKAGGEFWAAVSYSPIRNAAGQIDATLGVITDITRSRALEEQLLQAQKMESIGRLAGGIAHDFNNLLTVINGYSDLVVDKVGAYDPIGEKVALIRNAGGHAASLTQQLLAFSRKQMLQPRILDLNQVIADVEKMLARVVPENIEIRLALSPEPARILADPGQMSQIVMNLCVNARDAMPDGGYISIKTEHVHLDRQASAEYTDMAPGGYIKLAVSDNGVGMDAATQSKIFEPFFTARSSGKGTGLGLATVYGIIKQTGGFIQVHSEVGIGTEFVILLPAAKEAAPETEPQEIDRGALRGDETILLVEDQDAVRNLTREILESYGYTVLDAANGAEALLRTQRHAGPIHLLLSDAMMPGLAAKELVAQLRSLRPEVKCMLISGYVGDLDAYRSLVDADIGFLQKPFHPDVLAAKVREILGSSRVSGTILVVDDEAAIRRLLRLHLESAGYNVLEAANGRTALDQLKDREVDLVISDLHMPEMEGIELLRLLHQQKPAMRIIAMSGAHDTGPLEATKYLGACAVLEKPFQKGHLLEVVRDALTGQAVRAKS